MPSRSFSWACMATKAAALARSYGSAQAIQGRRCSVDARTADSSAGTSQARIRRQISQPASPPAGGRKKCSVGMDILHQYHHSVANRILIYGVTGTGKTTLAAQIAA